MLELLLFIICLVFVFLMVDALRIRRDIKRLEDKKAQIEAEWKQALGLEKRLRQEVNKLQVDLHRSLEDSVTNLLGWSTFEDRLNQRIKESERFQNILGVLFVDIDDFKMINDALSYEVGDELLREVAKRLQACIRLVDSVSRFTKDTFAVLLAQLAKPEMAALVAQRMLQALKEPFTIKGNELYITVCIGIAIYPADGSTGGDLLRSAEHALQLAKEKGQNLYQFYQEKLHSESHRELLLATGLSREDVYREFALYYQPIMNVKTDSIECMNVLLHWQHPEFGLISPQELTLYATRQRKLNDITEWLIKNACAQFVKWRSLGFDPKLLAIPVTIKQLEKSHFIYTLSKILQDTKFNPECLVLEMKEDFSPISFDVLEKSFNMLKYLGIKLAIDGFGMGSFSLGYMKNVKINYVKIERALIADIETNDQTRGLVKSIVYLANKLGFQVVVNGVESNQMMDILKELGCYLMQGNFLGVPLLEHEVIEKSIIPAK